MTQIFISYSRKDLSFIEHLAIDLEKQGFDVWYDLSDLEGGDRWNRAIQQAIQNSQYVILVLSPDSVESKWVEKEFFFADKLNKKIIPLYYRPCELGLAYVNLHYIEVDGEKYTSNFNKVLRALDIRKDHRKPETKKESIVEKPKNDTESFLDDYYQKYARPLLEYKTDKLTLSNGMEFMRVPAGKFLMGSNNGEENEKPQHTVDIPYDYWMARYPVTNELYNAFIKSKEEEHPVESWEKIKNHPVVYISWKKARIYCQWLNNLLHVELPLGFSLRLPTEAEWEKASRGTDGREYPWGNTFDKNNCNTFESGIAKTVSIGLHSPQGDSPYGCADMIGNVWEWTHSLNKSYPYIVTDGREDERASGYRVLRGGSFYEKKQGACCTVRLDYLLDTPINDRGFRVVLSLPHPK